MHLLFWWARLGLSRCYCTAKRKNNNQTYADGNQKIVLLCWKIRRWSRLTNVFPSPYPFSATFCLLACPFQQVQEDDLLITGFICLSSSREIIPKCEGSSNIIFATRYPAIDHVWYFLACLPIYLPSFPS